LFSDHARGQGAGRLESAAYTIVCEHLERPATPSSGVRRGYETTSNDFDGNSHTIATRDRAGPNDWCRCLFADSAFRHSRIEKGI